MSKRILRREPGLVAEDLRDLPALVQRVLAARGVTSKADLDLQLGGLLDGSALSGLDRALTLLEQALHEQERILIVGDFDADGATSTALAMLVLRSFGAHDVRYLVPNRFQYGYGLTPEIVDLAAERNPALIVTVDNGMSSVDGVARAHEYGIRVLITDHHLPGEQVPNAAAIVNPNQRDCPFPGKNLAGVGVIFYLLCALRTRLKRTGWFERMGLADPNMADYLDLVALGTVADLVPLDRNNRILVEQGLRRIRAQRCRPGISALLAVAGRANETVQASDLGFAVGPRLNAAGRLDDMALGIECLLAETFSQAMTLATELDRLNQERKQIEGEMKLDAQVQLDRLELTAVESRWGICLYEPHWHQGVIGILASRIKERLHRPAIVFAPASDDPDQTNLQLKGSARSIPGLHMRDTLDRIAKRYPDLLTKFGGHAMAAGMSIVACHYDAFARAFDEAVRDSLREQDLVASLLTDGELAAHEFTLEAAAQLARFGPWGQQFPEPAFDGVFSVIQHRVLKGRHLKLVLGLPGTQLEVEAIQFNSDWVEQAPPRRIRAVYRPDINEYRGRQSLQLMLDYLEPA
jgi:single-stranded-DNA-specific exonuclease